MIQAVVPDPVLSQAGPLAALIACGAACAAAFVADQFLARDALIPPGIFVDRVFSLTTAARALMGFVRNSITYNMIFYLQGPLARDPLQAGIGLIPHGVGIMAGGLVSGGLADRLGVRAMVVLGPLVALAGAASLAAMDQRTPEPRVAGLLFLTGLGLGLFQSPSAMANMLSVPAARRGVAAAVGMLTTTLSMMVGMVLTFSLVLHSMSSEQLFALFVNGGGLAAPAGADAGAPAAAGGDGGMGGVLGALATDYYIIVACCAASAVAGAVLPRDLQERLKRPAQAMPTPASAADSDGKPSAPPAPSAADAQGGLVLWVGPDRPDGAAAAWPAPDAAEAAELPRVPESGPAVADSEA